MTKREHTEADPMRAWLKRDKKGKWRAYRYKHQGHYYKDGSGVLRKTNWLPISYELAKEFLLKGTAVLCYRDNTILLDRKVSLQGWFAFWEGEDNPFVETRKQSAELSDADLWAIGWQTALDYGGSSIA